MDCMRTQKLFRGYLNGKLSDRELKEFLDHVESCPKCWGELEIYFAIYHVMYDKRDDGNYNFIEKLNLKIRMSREYLKKRYYYKVFRVALVFFAQMTLLVTVGTAYVKKHDMIPQDEQDGFPNVSLGSGWERDYEDKPDNADTVLPFETMIRIEELPNETAAFEPDEIDQELLQLDSDVTLPAAGVDLSGGVFGTVENVPAAGPEAVSEASAAAGGESSSEPAGAAGPEEVSEASAAAGGESSSETNGAEGSEAVSEASAAGAGESSSEPAGAAASEDMSEPAAEGNVTEADTEASPDADKKKKKEISIILITEETETELFDPDEQKKALAYTNSILYHVLGLEVPSDSESEKETGQQ